MKRRQFLQYSLGLGTLLAVSITNTRAAFAASLPADIVDFDGLTLSRAIHGREVSCHEVMQAYLNHIALYNPVYNAIVSMVDDQSLLRQAQSTDEELAAGIDKGWMHGFPHAVKDLQAVAGIRFTSGSPMFADRIAESDSLLAMRLRQAGVIFIGKTNTPEFGLGSQSYNQVFGATGSAWNPELTSGGSSGGAASGLGTHMLPVADGSDMMGSLRNPGAFNNVIGFRPSVNVISGEESDPRALSTRGPMGRNVRDTIALLGTLAARPVTDNYNPAELTGSRIAWLGDLDGYLATEDGVTDLCEASLQIVAEAGAEVESVLPKFNMSDLWQCWTTLRHRGRARGSRQYYDNPQMRSQLKPELVWEIEQGLRLTDADESNARRIRADWYRELDRLFENHDFLVLPTAQVFPFPKLQHWPTEINGRTMDSYHRWMEIVIPGSLGGLPVLNVPVGFDAEGRPMGMQIMGRYGDDQRVLEFGLAYELITDFLSQRPRLQSTSA